MKKQQKKWLVGIGIIVVVVVMIVTLLHKNSQTTSSPAISTTINKTYTDTKQQFTVRIPDTWMTTEQIAKQTTGLNTPHPVTRNIQVTQLYSDQGVGITMQVYEGKPDCPILNKPNTTFGGLPAYYNALRHEWTIYTTTSMIVVRDYYPGTGVFHTRITPTPVPADIMNAYNTMLQEITTSFHLNNMQPFSC